MSASGWWTARVTAAAAAAAVALSPATVDAADDDPPRLEVGALRPSDRVTSVVATPVATPRPVRTGDRHRHLVYELLVTNANPIAVDVQRVAILDRHSREVLDTLSGDKLRSSMGTVSGTPGTRLRPGQVGLLVLDLRLGRTERAPAALAHRLTIDPVPDGIGPDVRIPAGATPVGQREPLVVAAPLQGRRWLDVGGCCGPGSHRTALLPVNGALHLAQRYAVDLVRISPHRRVVTGPLDGVTSYAGYGQQVRSATAGTVVRAVDRHPNQVPFDPDEVSLADAGGNVIGVSTGDGRFVWYAHLKPGSVRVQVGDHVHVGQPLGRVGNSGNSDLPHLHFQVSDGPTLLGSEGEPWTLAGFRSAGATPPIAGIDPTQPMPIGPRWAGPHRFRLPLERQVLAFP